MNFKSFLLAVLVAATAFGGGWWLGRRPASQPAESVAADTSSGPKLPLIATTRPAPASPPKSDFAKITTLAEAEQALRDLEKISQNKRWESPRLCQVTRPGSVQPGVAAGRKTLHPIPPLVSQFVARGMGKDRCEIRHGLRGQGC